MNTPSNPTPSDPDVAADNAAASHMRPDGGKIITIDGKKFVGYPVNPRGHQDPARGVTHTDTDGNEYYCIPYERWQQEEFGRRYTSGGRVDPNRLD